MNKITSKMHRIVRHDPFVKQLSGSIDISIDNADNRIDSFVRQLDIDTATWGLDVYERELGIPVDHTKPIDQRRSLVKSKLRGSGKMSAANIKLVVDSYTNGDVSVSLDHGIVIEFNSVVGIPNNMNDLKRTLRDVVPAHLAIYYSFRYLLIKEIEGVMTINQLQQTLLSKFAGGA